MKKLIILIMKNGFFSRGEISYINRPFFRRNSFRYEMNLQTNLFFITNLFAPYFYYRSTGSLSSVGFGYSEVIYGGND